MSWYSFLLAAGFFKTYTLKTPGIKKDRMAAVECVVEYAQKSFWNFVKNAIDKRKIDMLQWSVG